MMWNSARAWGYVAHDPFDGLVLPKRGLVQTVTFSLDEINRILDSASEPFRTFYAILAETGIRGGEICALRVTVPATIRTYPRFPSPSQSSRII